MPEPTNEALVDVGSSSIREPLYVATYAGDEGEEDSCLARMALSLSDLPSRRLVPRPRELAEALAPVANAFGARTCAIAGFVEDIPLADDAEPDPEACQSGTFRFDGDSWSTVEDDAPCW